MIPLDDSQQAALSLDPTRHARIVGAPGSGKSTLVAEMYAHLLEHGGYAAGEVLALAPDRLAASALRDRIERRVARALGVAPARSVSSFAFSVLGQAAARTDASTPRLLTGNVQDEAIRLEVERALAVESADGRSIVLSTVIPDEVLRSAPFRAELREFWRVIDDFDIDPTELRARLQQLEAAEARQSHTALPAPEILARWSDALALIAGVSARLTAERAEELSSSQLLRAATAAVRAQQCAVPKLILVDDAQELGEGQLALLAACAEAGAGIWVLGDPDIATTAFHGEPTRVLQSLSAELQRRSTVPMAPEQVVILGTVHRQTPELRNWVQRLTARIGAAGAGAQRAAPSAREPGAETPHGVMFARAGSPSEQLGIIAHRMRARKLGLDGNAPLEWSEMAVLCRSRTEASRIARGLAAHQVPTGVAAGGIVLREHRIVRDLVRMLQHALGAHTLDAAALFETLSGSLGELDPVAMRRLRGAVLLAERRDARDEGRETRDIDEVILDAFRFPGVEPVVDSAAARALRKVGLIAAAGVRVHEASGTPREVLWAIWDASRLATRWQDIALGSRGARADEAHRSLDAVLGLFYALQRHEENDSDQPIEELLVDLLESAVPEDTLARRGEREAVVVTTPQGTIGREFALVAIVGPEDGVWPNTRARGSLLGTIAFERWLRGGEATTPSRADTIHDELRLFAHASSRASDELFVVAVADEDHHPSPFFGFGRDYLQEGLPSSRLTLRGATAAMRRRLVADPHDISAIASLTALVQAEAPGATPDEWYGVLPPSSDAALHDLSPEATPVPVSPSQLEGVERCPLDWVVSKLGGGNGSLQASLGTLVHHAFEHGDGYDAAGLLAMIMSEWGKLPFAAPWESQRTQITAASMAEGLAAYLREFESSDRHLIGREAGFSVQVGPAELRGMADRIETRASADGTEVTVLDLKTGATPPSKPETERHAQLQAYQLGVILGAFDGVGADASADSDTGVGAEASTDVGADAGGEAGIGAGAESGQHEALDGGAHSGGARLLYVHPDAAKGSPFIERVQPPLSEEAKTAFIERITAAAETMASNAFTARIEHHCSDPHQPGSCRIHIIPAVSHS